ncbi:MAG TPA: polyhydroxyalkanoate depolymerase, partial [Aestuariivirga sp.]|nr:polyhydroxyalkanoate depolymerase [Aestuariivirga sp.]
MLYQMYEFNHAVIAPLRALATAGLEFWQNPGNPLAETYVARSATASLKMFERVTRRYGKPTFDIHETEFKGARVKVTEQVILTKPFCHLLHFVKDLPEGQGPGKKVLLVAPMSGHYATLLRDTVQSMLPFYDIYITDWIDARAVPLSAGSFDLDDYVDYIIEMLRHMGDTASVMAVCQPSVPVLAAVSVMEAREDPYVPPSMILMGGPIDTRISP